MGEKICIVPICRNTSRNTNKIFIRVPNNKEIKEKWWRAMNSKKAKYSKNDFVCEDHFDLEEDAKNWMFFKLMGKTILLKSHIVPHKYLTVSPENPQKTALSPSAKKRKIETLESLNSILTQQDEHQRNLNLESIQNEQKNVITVKESPLQEEIVKKEESEVETFDEEIVIKEEQQVEACDRESVVKKEEKEIEGFQDEITLKEGDRALKQRLIQKEIDRKLQAAKAVKNKERKIRFSNAEVKKRDSGVRFTRKKKIMTDKYSQYVFAKCDKLYMKEEKLISAKKKSSYQNPVDVTYFRCLYCPYATKQEHVIIQHRLTHLAIDKNTYQCTKCDYSFLRQDLLDAHYVEFHENLPPMYQCNDCLFKSSNRDLLICHKLSHLKCKELCGFSGRSKFELLKHEQSCYGEAKYLCDLCPYITLYGRSLRLHVKRYHKMQDTVRGCNGEV